MRYPGMDQSATALHYACLIGSLDIIKLLLDRGASHEALDAQGRKPLECFNLHTVDMEVVKDYNELYSAWLKQRMMADKKGQYI